MNLKGGGAKKFATDLFNESEKLVPKGAKVISPKLESSLENLKKKISANLDLVKKEVIEGLNEYGTHQNPEFLKLNKAANEAYGAYEASDKMASFIKKHVTTKNPMVKTLLGLGGIYKFPALAAKGAIGAPAVYGTYQAYKVLHQVIQSPTLRKFYGNILKGAAAGNASQVIKNSKALEKQFEED